MPSMRSGRSHKSFAITNSPIVRSLIKPIRSIIPGTLSTETQSSPLNSGVKAVESPDTTPDAVHLIPTQPSSQATSHSDHVDQHTAKKRRVAGVELSEKGAESKVQVSYTEDTLPPELRKYWAQRYRLFSKFDFGCQLDKEGWFSVTPEAIAQQIAERCRSSVIVDAFCGVGGNAIQFAFTCEKVIAIDNSPTRLACAKHNAKIYGVEDRIEFILGDYVTWAKEYTRKKDLGEIQTENLVEVVFLSPPWGGIDYQTEENPFYPLSALTPLEGKQLFEISREITPHIAFYLPRNVDVVELGKLAETSQGKEFSRVEIEEEWMNRKLKAVTAYFGELATNHANQVE